ncbi:hypothetical protein DXG01_006155 [Tephrocybe rancida]|nr:hypothetical protein DXG01_006155 [Tephrocybe rancida]
MIPVPLNELTEHICTAPPPVPTLPKPTISPAAASSLLPQHLQDRLPSPITPRPSNDARLGTPPPALQRLAPPTDHLKINTASQSSYQSRSSPLARNDAERTSSPFSRSRLSPSPAPSSSSVGTSPLRTRANPPGDVRGRRPSNAGSTSSFPGPSSPSTARPSFSREAGPTYPIGLPPREQLPPPPPRDPYTRSTPSPQIPEPDTKTGGEAGMAGVGRRGFAAAARAAMFVAPADRPMGPQPRRDRDNLAPFLNTDLPRRTNETPPLSAGSGNSSHSPGVSPYPQSPVGQQGPPSPERYNAKAQPTHKVTPSFDRGLPASPASLRQMPFNDKIRNQLPGVVIPSTIIPDNNKSADTPSTARQPPIFASRPSRESDSTFSLYSQGAASRSLSNSSSASRSALPPRRPLSPTSDSGSDYGGLAYADSTDYEDDEPAEAPKGKANPPPPLPLTSSILRSASTASTNHVRFPSSSVRPPPHKRNGSMSSISSVDSTGGESRKSNSAAIAQALGLSQAAPGAYGRLGGPGAAMGGRGGRSGTGSLSSSSGRSAHSRGGPGTSGGSMGAMEREVKTLLEDKNAAAVAVEDRRAGLSKSKSTGKQRTFAVGEGEAAAVRLPLSAKNPSISSMTKDERAEKVLEAGEKAKPARTKSAVEGNDKKKERIRKPKVCLKCDKKVEDGRWVAVDKAGVLCERCWKQMYLPKCRRCNLPIEKAAVSSSDGQLKGKYHPECFNCFTCHKPFPDKSFYVYDGKPLCAYHYHEANDSLCSAALCGQPIEGPCAISHTGDRYHPDHMLCEHPGTPKCKTKLAEYWEVDGRMLCERHAHASKVGSDDEEGEEEWVQSSKKMKRVTKYIDLAGGLPSGGLR